MRKINCYTLLILLVSSCCYGQLENTNGNKISTRFIPPKQFLRIKEDSTSFAYYLRSLPLKPAGLKVKFYNGYQKNNEAVYCAVVDLPIGKKNLHQCADAIMRLYAEFWWKKNQYENIHFNFTNGFRVDYDKWRQGYRIAINGNKTSWVKKTTPSNTYETFWKYLEQIFTYAGTLSLSKELVPVDLTEMQIGDIFIQGGSPGHAVIVVDMVINPVTKEKRFLLAQSYMPAQEIQILRNPNNADGSPWYSLKFNEELETPEWNFNKTDLKRFAE